MNCGVCTKIHCSEKKKPSASWDKVLNGLFRMSAEISDRGEIESTYSKFQSHAFTSRQPFSHFSAVSFHFLDTSILTVMCSLERRRRPNRAGTPSLIKSTRGRTVGWVPLSVDTGTKHGSCCNSSYQVLPLATEILNCKVFALLICYSTALTNQVSCLCWCVFTSADLVVAFFFKLKH